LKAVVRDLGSYGLIFDLPQHELPSNAWTAGQNVVFRHGSAEKIRGDEQVYGTLSGTPYWLLQAFSNGAYYLLYPSLTACYVTNGVTHKTITKTATTYSADADIGWTGGIIGGVPILNNGVDDPQQWDRDFATPGLLVDLPNWPANTTCKAMRVFKNFLIAMDVTETGTRYEDVVRWSHPAQPGAVPATWDYSDDTKDAGRTALSDTPGAVIDGAGLGNIFVLYKERGAWGMQETNDRRIFRLWPLAGLEDASVLSRNCIAQLAGSHLVLTRDLDLILHSGSQAQSIAESKWRKWLQANIDNSNYERSFLAVDRGRQEVWVCVPTTGASAPDVALVWNTKDNTLGMRELSSARAALWELSEADAGELWSGDSDPWSADVTTWDQNYLARGARMVLASGSKILRAGQTNQFDGSNMTSYVERASLGLIGRRQNGTPIVDFQSRKLANRIWLEMEGGPVNVYLLTQEQKGGAVTYHGPKTFDPASQKFVDIVGSGRTLGLRIESVGDVAWKLDGYEIIATKLGVH